MLLRKNIWIVLLLLPLSFCGRGDRSGLAEASEGLDYEAMLLNTGVRHILPAFALWYDDILQIPEDAYGLCSSMIKDSRHPETLFYHAFRMLGAPAGGFGPPLAGSGTLPPLPAFHFVDKGEESWQMLPQGMQAGILEYLQAWTQAAQVLDQFIAPLREQLTGEEKLMEPWLNRELSNFVSIDLMEDADLRTLSFASRLLASAVSRLASLKPYDIPEGFETCIIEAEMGRVGIFGSGTDTIDGLYGLIIDLGGDDHYRGHIASPSLEGISISVVLDFAGNDSYHSGEGYLLRSCLGIAMLFDLSGNDKYSSETAGIASACYGSALLYDRLGDDIYLSRSEFSQGAAHLGSGLLIDLDGDDEYTCSGNSQGYGGTLGVGMLLDLAGQDRYLQNQEGSSFIQGAGRGRWAEATDGHSLGGGMGIFIEAGGSDQYSAGSFSQGASYFAGTGLFFDLEGDDHYDALSHSQGYAAHYALAGFFEMKGDDQYNAKADFSQITQQLGSGRDLSAGWFIEEEGDDTYHFGNRSLGIGDLNGIGILWDHGGDDRYIWHQNELNAESPSLGQTISLSEGMALGSRMGRFPKGKHLGHFKDNQKKTLIIHKNN